MILAVTNAIFAIAYGTLKNTGLQQSFHHSFIPHGLIRTHKWPAPNVSGFTAQLVRASHRYHEITGSNPVEVLIFQASIRNCKNCAHKCEDYSSFDFTSAVLYMMYFIHHFINNNNFKQKVLYQGMALTACGSCKHSQLSWCNSPPDMRIPSTNCKQVPGSSPHKPFWMALSDSSSAVANKQIHASKETKISPYSYYTITIWLYCIKLNFSLSRFAIQFISVVVVFGVVLCSLSFYSTKINSTPFQSFSFHSIPLHFTPFYFTSLHFISLQSISFHSTPLLSTY